MEHVIAIAISFGIAAIISFFWVRGINYMHKHHPNYKGEDFLDWENSEAPWVDDWDTIQHSAGRDGWDDEKVHTEGDF